MNVSDSSGVESSSTLLGPGIRGSSFDPMSHPSVLSKRTNQFLISIKLH